MPNQLRVRLEPRSHKKLPQLGHIRLLLEVHQELLSRVRFLRYVHLEPLLEGSFREMPDSDLGHLDSKLGAAELSLVDRKSVV